MSELASGQIQSLRNTCKVFASDEEAEAAFQEAQAEKRRRDTGLVLAAAGYPERAIAGLAGMRGPGMAFAEANRDKLAARDSLAFLIGHRGPGKTQIATYFAAQRYLGGQSCGLYRKALDLWSEIKATWRSGAPESEDTVVRRFRRCAFLVIDEAQERGDTEADRLWCDRMLAHLIDHRYDALLPTLLVANLDVRGYESTIPASVRSRVGECGGVKVCDWPSYRR